MTWLQIEETAARAREQGVSAAAIDGLADSLASQLAADAAERDRTGGHPAAPRRLVRDSGLLLLTLPRSLGGMGQEWSVCLRVVRRLAEADAALAHLFAFHHLQVATIALYGNDAQRGRLLRETVEHGVFWGNAGNPRDTRLIARPVPGGWRLDGTKSFASGSVGADRLVVSAVTEAGAQQMVGVLRADASGLQVKADWDAFGQRQTDSGTVRFDHVLLRADDVIEQPGARRTPHQTLRALIAQSILVQLYLGIAKGAFDAARHGLAARAKPPGTPSPSDDVFVQHRGGELWLKVRSAQALADAAIVSLDAALQRRDALDPDERAEVAVAVAEAKVLAYRAALDVSSGMFELVGAAATSQRLGLDRFWRNARVHTLHDPIDHKLRDIGNYRLSGTPPEPTAYS